MFRLVLGTGNSKKRAELEYLLQADALELLSLADFEYVAEPEETGDTFGDNAALKASYYAKCVSSWVLAEDSGLSVPYLNGAPGVYSARFSGELATDESNNRLLLQKLQGVPLEQRNAWYTCHIAVSDPDGNIRMCSEGRCQGRILWEPIGEAGFGYDPLFEIPEYKRTFAQLGESVKAALSHRGRAYRRLLPALRAIIRTTTVQKKV